MNRVIKEMSINAKLFELQPGDLTKYQFLISESVEGSSEYIHIVSTINAPPFKAYEFKKEHIEQFFKFVGLPPIRKDLYKTWANDDKIVNNDYLMYAIKKGGDCNYYTALAALTCGLEYIKIF